MKRSPGAHSPLCRRTSSHNSPALAGLLHTRAGLLSNWAGSSRGKDSHSRSSRTTKRQLSPTATACQESRRELSGAAPMVSPNRVANAPALAFASPCHGMRSHGTQARHSSCADASQSRRESSVRPQRSGGRATKAPVRIFAHSLAKADSLAPSEDGYPGHAPAGYSDSVRIYYPESVFVFVRTVASLRQPELSRKLQCNSRPPNRCRSDGPVWRSGGP